MQYVTVHADYITSPIYKRWFLMLHNKHNAIVNYVKHISIDISWYKL